MQYKINTRCQSLLADLQTPVSLYLKVRDIFPESALLESTDFHVVDNRYSFIGIKPLAKFTAEKGTVTIKAEARNNAQATALGGAVGALAVGAADAIGIPVNTKTGGGFCRRPFRSISSPSSSRAL